MLYLLLMVGLCLHTAAPMFHSGYEYDYDYTSETEIMGMDNLTTLIQMTLTPVDVPGIEQTIIQLKLNDVTQYTLIQPVRRTLEMDLIKLKFYFSVTDTGLVDQVYSHPAEADDIRALKKSIAAAFSHRQEVGEGDEWSYSEVEDDHMGSSHHHYEGERTTTGYNLWRSHSSDEGLRRRHNRHIKLDHSGHVHSVMDNEEVIVHDEEQFYASPAADNKHFPDMNIQHEAREPRVRASTSLQFQDKRPLSRVPVLSTDQLSSMEHSGLPMVEHGWRKHTPGSEVFPKINKLLRCTSKYPKADRRRVDCVAEMMQLLYHVRQSDLSRWGKNILNRPCKPDNLDCSKARETLINVIGQVKSPESQRLIVNEVVRKDPDEEELKRAIFHLGAQEKPIQETFEALRELCFGEQFEKHGLHSVTPNQRRGCLALGSVLRVHEDGESADTMIHHLHTWLDRDMDRASSIVNIGYSNRLENMERSQFIHTKHVLLESLANAAHPKSKPVFMKYAAPNHGHAGWRHAALGGLKKFHDQEAATTLLNSTMSDDQFNVRAVALKHYKEHPHGFNFQQDDAVILDRHNISVSPYHSMSRRSVKGKMCNLLERLTFDKEFGLPTVDWKKKVGNKMFGAEFGIKMVNKVHLHISPVAGFFEAQSVNSAYFKAWVNMIIKFNKDIMIAESCYAGDIRLWNISFVKDFAKDKMQEITGDLDLNLEGHADAITDSVNSFNDLLGEWNIPSMGLFDLDMSSPTAFVRSVMKGVENAMDKDWKEYGIDVAIGLLNQTGMDGEKFRGMFSNSKEWAKERLTEIVQEHFEDEWEKIQESVEQVKEIINKDLGEFEVPLEIMDKVLDGMSIKDLIDDPKGFGQELVSRIKTEIKDITQEKEDGLMGQINTIVNATREFPDKLNGLRDKIDHFKDNLLDIEGLDWAQNILGMVQRVRYFIEDDSSNILDFFQEVIDENGITLPFISQLVESANKFIENAAGFLTMSPQQAMTDITRAVHQMRTGLASFASIKEDLMEANADIAGKLESFMKLGGEYEKLKMDLEMSVERVQDLIASLRGRGKAQRTSYTVNANIRGLAEKIKIKADEVEMAEEALVFLEEIRDGVFNLNYLADKYQDGFDRTMESLEITKERFEDIKHSVAKAKEFVREVFGVKFHPNFPNKVRDECDEVCECGMYPSHMYGRVGVQLMADEGDPIVCPMDAYVKVGKEHPDELVIQPVDEDLEDFEMVISHIVPDDYVLDIEEDEEEYGQLMDAGAIIGYATNAPCDPNFIYVCQRQRNDDISEEVTTTTTEAPEPEEPDCGSTKAKADDTYYAPVEEYSGKPFPAPKWVTHCAHTKWEHILKTFDLEAFAEKWKEKWDKLERPFLDISKKILSKASSVFPNFPEMLDPKNIDKMMKKMERKLKQFPKKCGRFLEEKMFGKSYSWKDGLKIPEISMPDFDLKFPHIEDFININGMRVNEMMGFLEDMDLMDKVNQLQNMAEGVLDKLKLKVMDNPFKFSPSEIRAKLGKLGERLEGLNLDDLSLKFFEKMKECGPGMVLGQGSICDAENACAKLICSIKTKIGNFIDRLDFDFDHNECTREIWITINDHEIYINYDGVEEAEIEETFEWHAEKKDVHGSITAVGGYKLDDEESTLTFNLGVTPCIESSIISTCAPTIEVMKEFKINITFEIITCEATTTPKPIELPDIDDLLNSTMKDFMYIMDRTGQDRRNIIQLVDELRTSTVQTLMDKTGLNSSIDGNEIHNPQDVESEDRKPIGEFDITFFKLFFKFPAGPLIFTVEIGAGGVVGVDFGSEIKILSSSTALTLSPWVAGKAWGSGSATIVGMGGGLKMTGYLLQTSFPFTMLWEYEKYPMKLSKILDVELVPLRVKFEGFIQILILKIPFKIFEWSADKLSWNIFTKVTYKEDGTPPDYVGDSPPNDSRKKRSLAPYKCHVEQIIGRHPTDAAFLLEAPMHDEESELDVQYAIGTFPGGTNVLGWHEMEGPTLTNVIQLKETGVPLHWTVKAKNTQGLETVLQCSIESFDVTLPTGRMEANYMKTSHPNKISSSMIVIDDSPLVEEQFVAVGVGEHYYGHSEVDWHHFELEKNPINKEASGSMEHFASSRVGKLTSTPFRTSTAKHDYDCAQACLDFGEKCVSFDYEYQTMDCELHATIQGPGVHLRVNNAYRNFERLGSGHSAWFSYDNMPLIHGEVYYINARITNNIAYTNYLTSPGGIIVDFTPPEPGPVGDTALDMMRHDGCDAAFNHGERCVDVTPNNNHRWIIDGPGAETVFNGNWPKQDMLYTISNHYMCGNWDGFHDHETDLWAYTWAAGSKVCSDDVVQYEDPHSHLADKSYWNHQGYASGLVLSEGVHYVTVQSLNDIVHGGALVTTVCHYTPLIIDLSPPFLEIVEDVFFDEDFDIMAIYYKAYDPESGILRADFALGETQHDAFVRAYSRHDPTFDGYEMITVDDVDLPHGIPLWVRIRPVNNVELMTAGHGDQPIMIDTSPPVAGEILDGDELYDRDYQPYDHRMCAQWLGWFDPESGINSYQWAVGSTPGAYDIMPWRTYDHWHRSDCVDVPLNHSQIYFNVVRAYNQALNSRSTNMSSDGIVVDMTDPIAGFVHDGFLRPYDMEYSAQPATVQTYWADFYDPESGIDKYDITVDVNGQEEKHFEKRGVFEELEDHTFHLKHNDFVEVTVKATDGATRTNTTKSNGYRVDLTPPDVKFLRDNKDGYQYMTSNTEMYATWQYKDYESGITEYRVLIYQHEGGNVARFWPKSGQWEVYDPHDEQDNTVETTIKDLNMKNGRKYSVEVTAINGAKLGTQHQSHGVIVDTTPPVLQNVYIGFYGADEDLNDENEVIQADPETIHASWKGYDHESGILKFMVAIGKYPGDTSASQGFIDFGSEPSGYIRDLDLNVTVETGDLYYVSVKAMNGAGAWSDVVSSKPIHVYGANVPGTVLDGRKRNDDSDFQQDITSVGITFEGFESPACGIRSYEWALGSEPGWSDIMPYSSVGIVMLNETHGHAQAHLPLRHDLLMYASVRAHTGHSCHEAIIHSSSDGSTVDTEPPHIVLTMLGLFGMDNDTEEIMEELSGVQPLYQSQYDSIDLRWNATDETSDVANVTWMAGSLPLVDDEHEESPVRDNQIPMMSVVMHNGQTVIFSIQATDFAGNKATLISPPLTIDTTPPVISDFACTKYLSKARSMLTCLWESTLDEESPLTDVLIGLGTEQMEDNVVPFYRVRLTERTWSVLLPDTLFDIINGTSVVSLLVDNMVQEQSGAYYEVILDNTPPISGTAAIVTTERVGEVPEPRVCQRSITTMAVHLEGFTDPDTDIESYEVGVGSYEGGTDIMEFKRVQETSIIFDKLALVPGEIAYATVKAINKAGLHSAIATSSVHISPYPSLSVLDGLEEKDKDFQNDPSSISGQTFLSYHCPMIYGVWSIHNLYGDVIMEETQFYNNKFANDELRLDNMQTFYVSVEIMDALNRTFRGRSNGVTIYIQPPDVGAVRDGPYHGEERNYQQSLSEASVNWDDFGSDDIPGQRIVYYEVALGDNPAYSTTRSNTHYFVNVGLEKNYTFTDLRLIGKTVTYYATVRAHAESGAYVDGTSSGIKAGFTPGMLPGNVELAPYSNSSSTLSLSWDGFWSDFRIIHYHWGISSQPLSDSNVTVSCREYLPQIKGHFDVLRLQDAKDNTMVTRRLLNLQHDTVYYVTVIAEDEPGQCLAAPSESILIDLTAPVLGKMQISGISKQVQYLVNPNELHVTWSGFHDPESDIADFYLQLFQGDACNEGEIGDDHHFEPFSDIRDVKNETDMSYFDYTFASGHPYRIAIQVKNNAGSESITWSEPIFVDTSPAERGDVKDGKNWKMTDTYQPYTDRVFGTFALSPLGSGLYCKTQKDLLNSDHFEDTWTILDDYDVLYEEDTKLVEYQTWNIRLEDIDPEEDIHNLHVKFHRNISLPNLEGGAMVSDLVQIYKGKFSVLLKASSGDNTILSVTFSEGFLDDYTGFEMVNHTDRMPTDEFDDIAQEADLDWDMQPSNDTEAPTTTHLPTPPANNSSDGDPIFVETDIYWTTGFGMHFVGHSFGEDTEVWYMMMWARVNRQISKDWVLLDFDPSEEEHEYDVDISQNPGSMDNLWNILLYIDGVYRTEISGIELPTELSVKIRNWNYDGYIPPITDPFNPFMTESVISKLLVPLPQDKMCHYGSAFYDMESGVEDIYIGLGNTTDMEDNVVSYHKVNSLCHPCIYRCDYYKCQENCTILKDLVEGYQMFTYEMSGLNLHPGDTKPMLQDDSVQLFDWDESHEFEDEANQTFFDSIRYKFLVKVINEAGFETFSSSPGIILDPYPPVPIHVVSVDPLFHMTLPATHQGHLDSLAAWWEFDEPESFITEYQVAVGTKPNGTELMDWTTYTDAEELLLDELHLEEHVTYYFTVQATNAAGLQSVAHTDGITVRLGSPDVEDAEVSLPGVDMNDVIVDENGEHIYFNPSDDSVSLSVGGKLPDDTLFIEWSIGLSSNDTFLLRPIAVMPDDADKMEIKDGFFWYRDVQSKYSLREAGVRTVAESNATDDVDMNEAGRMKLEPGTCIYHHVDAMNLAHQKTPIHIDPMCVKGPYDEHVKLSGADIDVNFKRAENEGSISGKGISGNFIVSLLDEKDLEETYEISSNMSYIPAVVNPQTTSNLTSRLLFNRLLHSSGRGIVLSPTTTARIDGALQVSMSFDGIPLDVGQFVAIIYWDRAGDMSVWRQISESSGISEEVDFNRKIITGMFQGAENPPAGSNQFDLDHILFVLHTIDAHFYNSPPHLTSTETHARYNSLIMLQLHYYDAEGDDVIFALDNTTSLKGFANVTESGLLTYHPEMWFFGDEVLTVILQEVNLPPVIAPNIVQELFHIHIPEPSLAPHLYLHTESSLDGGDISAQLLSGRNVLGFEANTTHKDIGLLYLCDVNVKDHLEILFTNRDSNVTYKILEVNGTRPSLGADNDLMDVCLDSKLRVFHITSNTSMDYHGSDQLILIGHDDSVLYSQPLVLDVYTMISPCVHGHCEGTNGDTQCTSSQRAYSFDGYGCNCDSGYRGDYCDNSHLLPFEIILIAIATASVSSFLVFAAVKQYRRRKKVVPVVTPEGMEMEEVPEYETDTESSESEEETEPRALDVIIGTGEAERRFKQDFKHQAHKEWFTNPGYTEDAGMTEIDV